MARTPESWDADMLRQAYRAALRSQDPNTKVGAVIGRLYGNFLYTCNKLPHGVTLTPEQWADRELKNRLIVHAEMGAILQAAESRYTTRGATLYIVATDDTGLIWGGPPCSANCLKHVLAAGIARIVTYPPKPPPSAWHADCDFAREWLARSGVPLTELPLPDR